jgi:glycosyltransferase involved in cell wall biosynthesis
MPLPLVAPSLAAGVGKADFGLDARFTFLFSFDFLSVFERKNPLGVINAFRDAFGNGEGPVLMIKTINGQHRQQDLERLRWAARGRSDIVVFDGYLDPGMMGALTASCDCYVSLHRAEGLGLTMSEAMALGKPVIATAYSGNMDFMTPETAYLVPWHLSRIGDSAPPYPSEGMWAEPDIAVASRLMRGVMDDPGAAALVGEGARDDLALRFSPVETGIRIRQRLEAIWGARYA